MLRHHLDVVEDPRDESRRPFSVRSAQEYLIGVIDSIIPTALNSSFPNYISPLVIVSHMHVLMSADAESGTGIRSQEDQWMTS